jgi:hypothetical protein
VQRETIAPDGLQAPAAFPLVMTALVWVVLPLLLVYVLASRETRWRLLKMVARWTVITFLFYLGARSLANQGGVAGLRSPCAESAIATPLPVPQAAEASVPQLPCTVTNAREQLPIASATPGFVSQPPEWVVIIVSLVLAAVIVALIWLMLRRRRTAQPVDQARQVAAEAEEALAELQAGGDLRDTVMRCYSEMSEVLSRTSGLARRGSMTPREFEQFLIGAGVRDAHIQRLTRLFEAVRYGGRTTGERERREAIDCLTAIVRDHGQPV